MLEKLAGSKLDDPFPQYGLAMEYKRLDRVDEAGAAFSTLLERHATYIPAYLMYGNLLEAKAEPAAALEIYGRGIVVAEQAGDEHAASELQAAQDALT